MRILFCNIADMRFYQGLIPGVDEPKGGGSYVKREHDATESENFIQRDFALEDRVESNCMGAFVQKTTAINLHIERIEGCKHMRKEPFIEDVLVVWCAASHVVGWYKNATVYREYQEEHHMIDAENELVLYYNVEAKADDCVLLPVKQRNLEKWYVPHANAIGAKFGFGQANVWYAQDEIAQEFVNMLAENINSYDGENWACGRILYVYDRDQVTVTREKGSKKMDFTFTIREGFRPPVQELAYGKMIGDQFEYDGWSYTIKDIKMSEEKSH